VLVGGGGGGGCEVVVGAGAGSGFGLGLGLSSFGGEVSELPPPLLPPLELYATMLALLPLGTVTTQKLAPPAPVSAVRPLMVGLSPEISMLQGSPLHPPPGHSILSPNSGLVPLSGESSQIGLRPSFT
jgi:hypothetical protein